MRVVKFKKEKIKLKKIIQERLEKSCSICGKGIKLIRYTDKTYRGGHYFGKIPISTKTESAKARKAGTWTWKFGANEYQVMKKDSKSYKFLEYWECPKCYKSGPLISPIKNNNIYHEKKNKTKKA